jgi:hypothetical protein
MTDATFWGLLKLSSARWFLNDPQEVTRFADGSIISQSLGAALWQGEAQLSPAYHSSAAELEARLAKLSGPGQSFFAYDPRYNGPKGDPGGVVLGASTPTIHTLDADNKRLRVAGLPAGYALSAGDYIGWQYGSNPTRYALHRLVTGATADGAGLTPLFEVYPHIRPGVITTTAVSLVRPVIKARVLSSGYGAGVPLITQGSTFQFTQVLR